MAYLKHSGRVILLLCNHCFWEHFLKKYFTKYWIISNVQPLRIANEGWRKIAGKNIFIKVNDIEKNKQKQIPTKKQIIGTNQYNPATRVSKVPGIFLYCEYDWRFAKDNRRLIDGRNNLGIWSHCKLVMTPYSRKIRQLKPNWGNASVRTSRNLILWAISNSSGVSPCSSSPWIQEILNIIFYNVWQNLNTSQKKRV